MGSLHEHSSGETLAYICGISHLFLRLLKSSSVVDALCWLLLWDTEICTRDAQSHRSSYMSLLYTVLLHMMRNYINYILEIVRCIQMGEKDGPITPPLGENSGFLMVKGFNHGIDYHTSLRCCSCRDTSLGHMPVCQQGSPRKKVNGLQRSRDARQCQPLKVHESPCRACKCCSGWDKTGKAENNWNRT